MLTVLEVVRKTTEFFTAKGLPTPRLDAELLVGHALELPRMQLYLRFEQPLTEEQVERIRGLVRRRAAREPLQYIVGQVDFLGLKLKVDRRALIPRPETERLVEMVVARANEAPATVLDLGTGSGAIALALAQAWPQAAVTGVDSSLEALALAGENAARCGMADRVTLVQSDWFSALPADARYTVIVANPPYLSAEETAGSAVEVRVHEPPSALTADEQGVGALRAIIEGARGRLAPGGWLALETGIDQHAVLREVARQAGWPRFESAPDLTGRDRYVFVG